VEGINGGRYHYIRLLTARWRAATTERPVIALKESHQ
jgi:hypothetical protein